MARQENILKFPSTDHIWLGDIIERCWDGTFQSADSLLYAVESIELPPSILERALSLFDSATKSYAVITLANSLGLVAFTLKNYFVQSTDFPLVSSPVCFTRAPRLSSLILLPTPYKYGRTIFFSLKTVPCGVSRILSLVCVSHLLLASLSHSV